MVRRKLSNMQASEKESSPERAADVRRSPRLQPQAATSTEDAPPAQNVRRSPRLSARAHASADAQSLTQLQALEGPHAARETRSKRARLRAEYEEERQRQRQLFGSSDDDAGEETGGDDDYVEDDVEEHAEEETFVENESSSEGSATQESSGRSASRSSNKRARSRANPGLSQDSVDPPTLVSVEPPQKIHANWNEWEEYFETYKARTYQVLPVFETLRSSLRNSRIAATARGKSGAVPLIPEDEFAFYSKVHICTHGWPERSGQRKKGDAGAPRQSRPFQRVRATSCPFRFVVQLFYRKDTGKWELEVCRGFFHHNHDVSANTYKDYPVARGVRDPVVQAETKVMIQMGVKRSRIYDYLLSCGQNVTLKDVANMIQRARTEASSRSDDDDTAEVIAQFASEDTDNVITVDETDRGETGVVSLTSKYMRELYVRFPELLLVDTTHKTNRYNYQLLTLMVMDEEGRGQPVQHSVLETNGNWHMHRAVEHFKRANPEKWKLLRVVVVDKDLNEIRILEKHFPEAQVLICHFHVIKYLGTMCRKPEFGKTSQEDLAAIDAVIHGLVYAESADEYEIKRETLRTLCNRVGCDGFFQYFEKNWHSAQDKWVMYKRAKLPHLKNHTNNRLESFFGKFKDGLPGAASMSSMLTELINHDRRQRKEADYRRRPGVYTNPNYDDELQNVLRFTNPWVAKHVAVEYAAALNKHSSYEIVTSEDNARVRGRRLHVVSTVDWRCDCDFAVAMMLPCRHAMAVRIHMHVTGSIIPLRRVDPRWTTSAAQTTQVPLFVYNEYASTNDDMILDERISPCPRTRYKRALITTNRIASELAEMSDDEEFKAFESYLMVCWRNIRQQKRRRIDDGQKTLSEDAEPVQVSQTNSLFDENIGSVHPFNPVCPTFPAIEYQLQVSQSQQTQPDMEHEPDQHSTVVQVVEGVTETKTSDEPIDPDLLETKMPIPDNADKQGAAGDELTGEKEVKDADTAKDAVVKDATVKDIVKDIVTTVVQEYTPPDAATRLDTSVPDPDSDFEDSVPVKIRLNPVAKKTGRPALDKTTRARSAKEQRVQFNKSDQARRDLGEVTLEDVLCTLDRERPSLAATLTRLRKIPTKFGTEESRRPKLERKKNPVLNVDSFYLLPKKLLRAAIKVLPVENVATDAIWVASQSQSQSSVDGEDRQEEQEVVSIAAVGSFSRQRIEVMMRLSNLRDECEEGEQCVKWLKNVVLPTAPTAVHDDIRAVADVIARSYPSTRVGDLGNTDYVMAMLYRFAPPREFNDAILRATCDRLQQAYPGVLHAGMPDAKPKSKLQTHQRIVSTLTDRIREYSLLPEARTLLLPVNFGNTHWCGIIVDVSKKSVYYYDSLSSPQYKAALDDLAQVIVKEATAGYSVVALNSPIQFDGFSCGFFVCMKFWRYVDDSVSQDLSAAAINTRRFELLRFLLGQASSTEAHNQDP